jgi:hypothetical protein
MTKVLLNIRVDQELLDRLKRGATQSNRSLSNFIETLLWGRLLAHELSPHLQRAQVSDG